MTTYPRAHPSRLPRPHVSLSLVAIVGLAAALVGLGTWVLVDRYTGGSTSTENAATLIDKVNRAYDNVDTNAIGALYAPNAVLVSLGTTYTGIDAIKAVAREDFTPTRVAPVTTDGEFATTFVRLSKGTTVGPTTLSVFQIRNGKIVRQWNFEPGATAPFDNAAR